MKTVASYFYILQILFAVHVVISLNAACVKVSFLPRGWCLILIDPAHVMLQGTWN